MRGKWCTICTICRELDEKLREVALVESSVHSCRFAHWSLHEEGAVLPALSHGGSFWPCQPWRPLVVAKTTQRPQSSLKTNQIVYIPLSQSEVVATPKKEIFWSTATQLPSNWPNSPPNCFGNFLGLFGLHKTTKTSLITSLNVRRTAAAKWVPSLVSVPRTTTTRIKWGSPPSRRRRSRSTASSWTASPGKS